MSRTHARFIAATLALGMYAASPAAASDARQRLRIGTSIIIACGHVPGGCRDVKLLETTHPDGCTRQKWRLYPRRAVARVVILKACG